MAHNFFRTHKVEPPEQLTFDGYASPIEVADPQPRLCQHVRRRHKRLFTVLRWGTDHEESRAVAGAVPGTIQNPTRGGYPSGHRCRSWAPHIPRIAQVGPQVPPAPPLRCARNALRYGAGPSYGLPGQSATSVNQGRRSRAAKKVRISIGVHSDRGLSGIAHGNEAKRNKAQLSRERLRLSLPGLTLCSLFVLILPFGQMGNDDAQS